MAQKRLGDLLLEAGLISGEQLQSAITHQKIAKGRLGSNLVAMGFVTEDTLVEFLSQQMRVPRMDVRHLDIPAEVLGRIPKRMAEQYLLLPVEFKEPKTLVVAMSDPMDLNAVDSARFATGLNIEPVVAAHSAMKAAISDQYRKLQASGQTTFTVGGLDEGLPVNFNFEPMDMNASGGKVPEKLIPEFKRDPFFDEVQAKLLAQNAQNQTNGVTVPLDHLPDLDLTILSAPRPGSQTGAGILPERTLGGTTQRIESYRDRAILLGLVKLLQRRGIFTPEDLQRTIAFMIEAGEIPADRARGNEVS